ncbi:hypothetical protein PsorP6_001967 [Peronosclerospora sorghi]|uniref:Uncharacterized protein n=1 Tax=Peronosclerospora sorghi TaxID=230839 RepID=A0ACC0WW25_9STRA|nr:hypothetical protein PsorP6_001967 [Peronosclerospora sorghi]
MENLDAFDLPFEDELLELLDDDDAEEFARLIVNSVSSSRCNQAPLEVLALEGERIPIAEARKGTTGYWEIISQRNPFYGDKLFRRRQLEENKIVGIWLPDERSQFLRKFVNIVMWKSRPQIRRNRTPVNRWTSMTKVGRKIHNRLMQPMLNSHPWSIQVVWMSRKMVGNSKGE